MSRKKKAKDPEVVRGAQKNPEGDSATPVGGPSPTVQEETRPVCGCGAIMVCNRGRAYPAFLRQRTVVKTYWVCKHCGTRGTGVTVFR